MRFRKKIYIRAFGFRPVDLEIFFFEDVVSFQQSVCDLIAFRRQKIKVLLVFFLIQLPVGRLVLELSQGF